MKRERCPRFTSVCEAERWVESLCGKGCNCEAEVDEGVWRALPCKRRKNANEIAWRLVEWQSKGGVR